MNVSNELDNSGKSSMIVQNDLESSFRTNDLSDSYKQVVLRANGDTGGNFNTSFQATKVTSPDMQ